jgi:hypothetical protein
MYGYFNEWGSWGEPTNHTKYAPKSVKLTGMAHDTSNVPNVLSIQDIETEVETGKKCATRISFEKRKKDVIPEFDWQHKYEV